MSRMKFFRNLLIIFVLFFAFVSFMTNAYIKSTYKDIESNNINNDLNEIIIKESKATKINGYISGTIKNITEEEISKEFIVVECYSKYGNNIRTTYSEVSNIEKNETRDFYMKYKVEGVENIKIITTKEEPKKSENIKIELTKQNKFKIFVASLVILWLT